MDTLVNTVGVLCSFMAALVALAYAATRWGVDSRPSEPARVLWEQPL